MNNTGREPGMLAVRNTDIRKHMMWVVVVSALIRLVVIGGRDISSARRVSVVVRAIVKRLGCLLLVLISLLILFGILPILLEVVIWR